MKHYESIAIPEYLSVRAFVSVLNKVFLRQSEESGQRNLGESHDFPELFYVRRGSHAMRVGDEVYLLREGQMMIYAPLEPHTSAYGETAEVSILSFKVDFGRLPSIYNRVITLSDENRRMLEDIVETGVGCYERRAPDSEVGGMVPRVDASEYTFQKLKRDLELFLIEIYRGEGLLSEISDGGKRASQREQFFAVVDMLRGRLDEELTIDDIARAARMSVSKLKLLFRRFAGAGPINFFIDLKLERAKELISRGDRSLTEIAESLGFSSLHYFSRIFKARVGVPPSRYVESISKTH